MSNLRLGWSRYRADVICLVVIIALATLFMHRWLRPGYTSVPLNLESDKLPWRGQVFEPPQNLLISDPFHIFYPGRLYLTESLRRGTLPLWNPYILGGHPLVGDTNIPDYYPFNLLAALVLAPARALPILAWLHVILSGVLMYGFLRVLTLQPEAALFGSIPWMLCEFAVVWLEWPEKLSTLAWMPGMFACFEIAVQKRNLKWASFGGLAFGLQILGGHTQTALYSAMLLGLYAVFHTLRFSWTQRRVNLWPVAALAVIGIVGIGSGAVQLFPAYQLANLSHRGPLPLPSLLASRWPLRQAVTLWLPNFFGNAMRNDYWGAFNFNEAAAYFGVVPALLCLMSVFVGRRHTSWFARGWFLFVLLVAGGTWLVAWVAWVPGFSYFNLSRLAGLLAFPGAILAAELADDLLRQFRLRPVVLGLGASLLLIVLVTGWVIVAAPNDWAQHAATIRADMARTLALVGLAVVAILVIVRWPRIGLAGLIVLTYADLYQWEEPYNPIHPVALLYPQNLVVDVLRQDASVYRALPIIAGRAVFGENVLSVFGIAEVGGYTSLVVRRYNELIQAIDPQARSGGMITIRRFVPLYGLLNVKYVLSPKELPEVVTLEQHEGCARQTAPLTGSVYFEQSFMASEAGFNRIDLALAHVGQTGDQPVRLRVWRGNMGDELIADITTPARGLPDRDYGAFFFAPVPDSKGDRFTWRIEAPDARPDGTVAICLAQGTAEQTASFVAYGALLQQVDVRQGVWIYRNPNVLPRAYLVQHVQVAPGKQALQVLQSSQFNMYRTALLDAPLPPDQAATLSLSPVKSSGQATVTRYEAHRVDVEAHTPTAALLVLSDVYYPGWQVLVDGHTASLLEVNYALRGVYLPAGAHSVSFVFRPTVFYVGLATTALTTLIVFAIIGMHVLNKRTRIKGNPVFRAGRESMGREVMT